MNLDLKERVYGIRKQLSSVTNNLWERKDISARNKRLEDLVFGEAKGLESHTLLKSVRHICKFANCSIKI